MTNYYEITPIGITDHEFLAAIFGDQAHMAQVSVGDAHASTRSKALKRVLAYILQSP